MIDMRYRAAQLLRRHRHQRSGSHQIHLRKKRRLVESLDFAATRSPLFGHYEGRDDYYELRVQRILAELHQLDLECLGESKGWATERMFDWAEKEVW